MQKCCLIQITFWPLYKYFGSNTRNMFKWWKEKQLVYLHYYKVCSFKDTFTTYSSGFLISKIWYIFFLLSQFNHFLLFSPFSLIGNFQPDLKSKFMFLFPSIYIYLLQVTKNIFLKNENCDFILFLYLWNSFKFNLNY